VDADRRHRSPAAALTELTPDAPRLQGADYLAGAVQAKRDRGHGGQLLWLVISLVFKFYVANFTSYTATCGIIGGAIVLML
jgi:hypothetical protein